ncbi:ABC transporter ATP-binding protein, partial [Pseudomonadota bacterium]
MFKKIFKNSPIFSFFLPILKPYKWRYFVMLLAPVFSGFESLIHFYCAKLLIDALLMDNFILASLMFPIVLFCLTPIVGNAVWRIHNLVYRVTVPFVRQKITTKAYSTVLNHNYKFFQDKPTGTIVSKINGILDGYDNVWDNIAYGMIMFGVQLIVSVI